MAGNTAFALISVAVMVTLGIGAALTQFGLMIYSFGKWGFIWTNGLTGEPTLFFLSDIFYLTPGLAYAWSFSIIPSLAIAVTIINTSIARDRLIWNTMVDTCKPPYDLSTFAWSLSVLGQWGLALLSYFDLHTPSGGHYLGVALFGASGLTLNLWILYLDYGICRATYHPILMFDRILAFTTVVALILFVFGSRSVSAASEWVVLLVMIAINTLLPVRGARVVLSPPQIWYNSLRSRDKEVPEVLRSIKSNDGEGNLKSIVEKPKSIETVGRRWETHNAAPIIPRKPVQHSLVNRIPPPLTPL
jgi:hypothetical protein